MFDLYFQVQFILLSKLLEPEYRIAYYENTSEFSIEHYWYDDEDHIQMEEIVTGKNLKELFSNYVAFKRKKKE